MIRTEYNLDNYEFPFVAYTPEKITGKLPIIVQLHGAGEVGLGGEELSKIEKYGFPQFFKTNEIECILVCPQCPPNSFWVAQLQKVHTFIDNLKNMFDIDENRIYLTGVSMGGYGTWYTAMAYPDTFAAIVPVCGGGMGWRAPVLKMPIWAFHGSKDCAVDVYETMHMIKRVREANNGNDVRMTIFDDVDHDSWIPAYTMDLLEWVLSKSK